MCGIGGGPGPGGDSVAAVASGGHSGFGGPGIAGPGGGTGRGGMGGQSISAAQAASLGQESFGQSGGWGSSDWGQLVSGIMTGLGIVTANPALLAGTIVPDFIGMLPNMNISRPVPAESAETIMNQSGSTGQPAALPSISSSTPAPAEASPPAVDDTAYNKELMDQYFATLFGAPSGGGRGIRGAGIPSFKQEQKKTADEWLNKYLEVK